MTDRVDRYRVYAIRYATSPSRRVMDNFIPPAPNHHDMAMAMDFFVWVAISERRAILIDTGADRDMCARRGHEFLIDPRQGLSALGLNATDIKDIVITHMHWDHSGNLGDYPNATLHLQSLEMAHSTGPCMEHYVLRRPYSVDYVCSVVRALYDDRLNFIDNASEIAPGVVTYHVGGHTPGLQIVRIYTQNGWLVLASDAMHFYKNYQDKSPFPVLVNMSDYIKAFTFMETLVEDTGRIVPGHDPLVLQEYPRVRESWNLDIVRLDAGKSIEREAQ